MSWSLDPIGKFENTLSFSMIVYFTFAFKKLQLENYYLLGLCHIHVGR